MPKKTALNHIPKAIDCLSRFATPNVADDATRMKEIIDTWTQEK